VHAGAFLPGWAQVWGSNQRSEAGPPANNTDPILGAFCGNGRSPTGSFAEKPSAVRKVTQWSRKFCKIG